MALVQARNDNTIPEVRCMKLLNWIKAPCNSPTHYKDTHTHRVTEHSTLYFMILICHRGYNEEVPSQSKAAPIHIWSHDNVSECMVWTHTYSHSLSLLPPSISPFPLSHTYLLSCWHVFCQFDFSKVSFPYRFQQFILSHIYLITRRSARGALWPWRGSAPTIARGCAGGRGSCVAMVSATTVMVWVGAWAVMVWGGGVTSVMVMVTVARRAMMMPSVVLYEWVCVFVCV